MSTGKIAVICDPVNRHASVWKLWLEASGLKVDLINDARSFETAQGQQYDLVVPLISIADYAQQNNARIEALGYFSERDARLLTPESAIAPSSDKLLMTQTFGKQGLPQPWTCLALSFVWGTRQSPVIVKPRLGHSGANIHLIANREDFESYRNEDFLVQRFIENAECIRVIASPSTALSSYKKISPGEEFIASIERGARRKALTPSESIKQLAQSMVAAMGGGLMGVDILQSSEGIFALETNIPFGFDVHDETFRKNLTDYIHNQIR